MIDWSDGHYEVTGKSLESAAVRAVDALSFAPDLVGRRVLDLGCGTGNAALLAATRGAEVVAMDPAARLVRVAKSRADAAGVSMNCVAGDAAAIPAPDGHFDAVLSVFAIIFAGDAEASAREVMRVLKPGGEAILTSWKNEGALAQTGAVVRDALSQLGNPPPRVAPAWGDTAYVRALFEPHGAQVRFADADIVFAADSPEAWFDDQERNHPVWRFAKRVLESKPATWATLRAKSIDCLSAGNEATSGFRVTSPYLLIHLTKHGASA